MSPGSRQANKKQKAAPMAPIPASPVRVTRESLSKMQTPPRYTRATASIVTTLQKYATPKGGNQARPRANLSTSNLAAPRQNTNTIPTAPNLHHAPGS
jgi:hypothetical protein